MTEIDASENPAKRRSIKKRWLIGGAMFAVVGGLWLARTPIADRFIQQELDARGVPARYKIERIGFSTQRLTNVVIGDPKRPDLTARLIEVSIGYGVTGPYVSAITADGLRLYGTFEKGRLSLGALDKFRDPTNTDPFALPDLFATLTDARARIETPWGNVGAQLDARGHLQKNLSGTLAIVAPTLTAGGCVSQAVSFYGPLTVRDFKPRLVGPLRGRELRCADSDIAAKEPQVALDVTLGKDLLSWTGKVDAALASLTAGPVRAGRVALVADFNGDTQKTTLTGEGEAAGLSGPDFAVQRIDLDAVAELGAASAKLDGHVRFASAAASAALRGRIIAGAQRLEGSPVGPLAAKATSAVAAMLANVGGTTGFALAGQGQSARIELIALELRSATGAQIIGNADSRIAYLLAAPSPAFIALGRWTFGGGGLPAGSLTLDRQADGVLNGAARFAPYTAGNSRLTLDSVRFSGDRSGLLRFDTLAELSGPVAGGRIERLRVPIKGVLAPTGALALAGGCTRVSADRVEMSGLRFAAPTVELCSDVGRPLLSAGSGGLRGNIHLPRLTLRGMSGGAPLSLTAKTANIDLASMRWTLALAEVLLGEGDRPTRFSAGLTSGGPVARGMAGGLTDASGKIGAVPLDISAIDGRWTWSDGALSLDGSLLVSDAEPDARFFPLISKDANLRFADGVIDAKASFAERRSGVKILDTVIRHALDSGTGFSELTVDDLRFNDQFQPDQLTRLALGVVANVDGSVVGSGRIDWSPKGVASRGTFATAGTNLAAAFGPVTGLTTTLTFDDLIGLHSAPNQKARLAEVNPGIPVFDGEIEYQLLGDNRVRVHGGRWPFAGGELLLHPTTLNFNADQPRWLSFDLVGVDAAIFLQSFGFDNVNATGKFDGTLPVVFDGLGGRIENGRIDARAGGGTLAYIGELSNHNLGAIANFAFGALRSLKYDDLTIILNGNLDGEMVTDIRFGGVGQGEGATRNFLTKQIAKIPLIFNLKIKAPFRQLVTSAKGFYDPTILIEQNLSTLMQVQENAEPAASVQPLASEPVQ